MKEKSINLRINNKISPIYLIELPEEKPMVTGMQQKYKIGDSVKVICTSGKSNPASNLTWFINDRPVILKS